MMASKKNRYTQACFLKLENVEAGSGIRANFMYILFRAMAILNKGEFKNSKNALSVMIKSLDDTHEDAVKTDSECVSRVDYAGYYGEDRLNEKADRLVALCKEYGCILGPATIQRCANKLGMETEVFIWEWEL